MRIAEYKQIDAEIIENTMLVDDLDENGEVIGQHEVTITEEKPVMGLVYRDMTAEEEAEARAEAERMAEIERNREPSAEERLAMVEDAFAELCEVIFNDKFLG